MHELARLGVAIVVSSSFIGCASQPPPKSQPSVLLDDVMPSFESQSLNGSPVFSGAFEGKRLVVSFVASDCDACDATLQAAQHVYSDVRDVVVVGVFDPTAHSDARSIAQRYELRFPIVVDDDGKIAKRFQVDARPTTFVADGYGRVKWVAGSKMTEEDLTSAVRSLN